VERTWDRGAHLAGSMEAIMVRHGNIKRGPTEEERFG
jgi:hypothetical protein